MFATCWRPRFPVRRHAPPAGRRCPATIEAAMEQEGAARVDRPPGGVRRRRRHRSTSAGRSSRDFYGRDLPATSYIPQPPCEASCWRSRPWAWGAAGARSRSSASASSSSIARHNGIAWVHCAQVVPQSPSRRRLRRGDQRLRADPPAAGRRRRPLRSGDPHLALSRRHRRRGRAAQRYQELNRARGDFYQGHPLPRRPPAARQLPDPAYPASTGIGTEGRGIMISAIALATDRDDIVAVPLENPGRPPPTITRPPTARKSPKFSRAMALSCGAYATIFISGTASITDAETRHVGDAAGQTHETLDNIAALISEENLCRHGLPGLGTSAGGPGAGPRLHQAARGLRGRSRGLSAAVGRVADDLRRRRCLPPGAAGGDRRHRLFVQVPGGVPRPLRPAFSPDADQGKLGLGGPGRLEKPPVCDGGLATATTSICLGGSREEKRTTRRPGKSACFFRRPRVKMMVLRKFSRFG